MAPQAVWAGDAKIRGRSEPLRMALLTFSLVGLQFCWGIEMTYCTPYLLELGLTKSRTSLVWIAGPLSGLIMAPLVGALADRSKSKWGRRRPFMVVGALIVTACLLLLGWTKEVVQFCVGSNASSSMVIMVAVFSIYGIDFAINAVQWSCRSLIVDMLPTSKQQLGSAWAGRMVAIGHLVGYGIGALDLDAMLGDHLGDTQFKKLTVIAAIALLFAVAVTTWAVSEKVLVSDGRDEASFAPFAILARIVRTTAHTPPRILGICWIQFWSWIGWFPFLFYSTTWVGETYLRYQAPAAGHLSKDKLGEIGRIGSTSLVIFSLVTFIASIVFPWIVRSPDDERLDYTPRPPAGLAPVLETMRKSKPSLLTAWTYSHFLFAISMALTPFVKSVQGATVLVAACGIPWALQSWAPFTFMGVEINHQSARKAAGRSIVLRLRRSSDAGKEADSTNMLLEDDIEAEEDDAEAGLAGIYLGILNLFTTVPQFIGTFISMLVFSILEPDKHPAEIAEKERAKHVQAQEGPNAISVCLVIGAVCAVMASYATHRLKRIM